MQHSITERKKTKKNTCRYHQIADDIKHRIQVGVYPRGSALPPLRSLSKGYDVALMTITKAIETIRKEGILEVRAGAGCFVRGPKPTKSDSTVVGLVLSGNRFFGSWYVQFLDGLIEGLKSWKAQLKYYFFNPVQDNWPEVIENIQRDDVKVLLRTPNPGKYDEKQVSANLSELSIPVITIGSYDASMTTNCVSYNLANLTAYSVKQLVDRGNRNLALFHSGKDKLHMNHNISDGFQLGLQQHGISYEPQMEVTDYDSNGEVCMKQLSNSGYSPTGVIMTGAFMQGVSQWLSKNKKLRQSIECVGIVGRPERSTSLLTHFLAYMLVPARPMGIGTGKFAEKFVTPPSNTHENHIIPFSMLKVIE